MVILDKNTDRIINIPKTFSFDYGEYDLFVYSELTNKDYCKKGLVNLSNSPLYYQFSADFEDLDNNSEYRIKVQYHNFILEEDILRIGDYKDKKTSYDDEREYQEYRD